MKNVCFRLVAINLKAVVNVSKMVITNLLLRNAPGSIVNISSSVSLVAVPNHSVYSATKGAVDSFTRSIAAEYGSQNIRVNAVNPTVILSERGKLKWSDPKLANPMMSRIPIGR